MKRIVIYFTFILFSLSAHATQQDTYTFKTPVEANRFTELTQETRCVVCQNQNLADSNAPLAIDLREKIFLMISEEKSDEEIQNYLVKRYGEFILLKPRFNKLTFVLWTFPLFACVLVLIFFLRFLKRNA